MPLVIAVIFIIALVVIGKETGSSTAAGRIRDKNNMRKTNAELEQRTLDSFMKQGISFNDAFELTQQRISELGFDPCIPRDGYYNILLGGCETSAADYRRYDSFLVKRRRQEFLELSGGCTDEEYEEYRKRRDEYVYSNFPTRVSQYEWELIVGTKKAQAIPVGQYATYPGLGTCEVLAHDFNNWTYKLRVCKTGEIVNYIKIGDKRLVNTNNR